MQIGIAGASGNQWGGLPRHPASEAVNGVATDEDGDGVANVYDPADAIAGAAKYLVEHGAQQNIPAAIFAYNHANWYVEEVLSWASTYASGGFTVSDVTQGVNAGAVAGNGGSSQLCSQNGQLAAFVAPNAIVSTAVSYAEAQLGKPYLFGGTGPAAFDCSGLVMMAYRAAGVNIPRTSQAQWIALPKVPASTGRPRRPGVLRGLGRHPHVARPRRPGDRQEHDDRGVRHRHSGPRLHVRHAAVAGRRRDGGRLCPALARQRR